MSSITIQIMNFIIYSKTNCPYCTKVKSVLELTEQKHVVYVLDRDFTREKFGVGSTFPQVICDDKQLGGCVDTIRFLREQRIV